MKLRSAAALAVVALAPLVGCKESGPADAPKAETAAAVKPASAPANGAASAPAAAKPADVPAPSAEDIPAPPDVAAPPADAEKTASGLASKVLAAGTGDYKPQPQDMV